MFLWGGLALLAIWFAGVIGTYDAGTLVHVFLLVGLMLLLLAVLKAGAADAPSDRDSQR